MWTLYRTGIVASVSLACALSTLPAGAARPGFLYQDAIRRPEPFEGSLLRVNPPTFRWPGADRAEAYRVEISRSADFHSPEAALVREVFYRPLKPLVPGRWYWRYRPERPSPGPWSKPERFAISNELPRWELPDWKRLLNRVPKSHPRVYVRKEDLPRLRARGEGSLRAAAARWSRRLAGGIGEQFSLARYQAEVPAPDAPGLTKQQIGTKRRWASKAAGIDFMRPAGDFCWLWLFTGDEKFADEARRRVLAAASLDPEGFTSHRISDFGNAAIASNSALVYDLLHDRFSPAERSVIRRMLVKRAAPIMNELRAAPVQRLMKAHGWQHVYLEGAMVALALYGEEPVASEWLELALKSFVAFYPWFGGNDGGSQEGANYYLGTEMLSSLDTRDFFLTAFGLDLAAGNPWFRANPYFLIYSFPPGGIVSRIGDGMTGQPGKENRVPSLDEKLAASRMAALDGNKHAAAYAALIPGGVEEVRPRHLRWLPFDRQAASLADLPAARVFHDIGTVFMHSAHTDPENNIRLEFRSSPYGGTGHAHADQNSFHVIAFNEPLLLDSGYYTPSGDPHHQDWTRQTRAHNTILVDGHGQPHGDTTGYGRIRHFEQNENWVYAIGSAETAYREVELERFDRHMVWLKGKDAQTYVMVDDLLAAGGKPHRFEWLLHAAQRMQVHEGTREIAVRGKKGEAAIVIVHPQKVAFSQTDQFTVPALNWRRGADGSALPNQWHLRATPPPAAARRFLAVIQVSRPGGPRLPVKGIQDGVIAGQWRVELPPGAGRLAISKVIP
ncbi:MAG: DUF4962 domain-containing protein [Acidobacteria bacterium]|nr:DUF4962 domain-containing protein [Acidobacteriota bacterium]